MITVLAKERAGRPPAVIDLLTVERAASIGCPVEDIAALLGIGRATLYDHIQIDPAVADAIEKGRGTARATVRRMQWEKASLPGHLDARRATWRRGPASWSIELRGGLRVRPPQLGCAEA